MKPRLVIMLKAPVAGRVKTRLGRDIGMPAAAWWFRHQTAALIRRLQSPRWETVLFVTPDNAANARFWPVHLPRLAQGPGGLGPRMVRGLKSAKGQVVLIGGDIPGVQPSHIRHAFSELGRHDLVFGPASDGGFWLVGARGRVPKGLFENVDWSSDSTLAHSLASAGSASISLVDMLSDVDTEADLKT